MIIKKEKKSFIFKFNFKCGFFILPIFLFLFSVSFFVNQVQAVDGIMNGKTITGETDNYLFWLQTYDRNTSPYYFDRFFINKSGNVGIGTIGPGTKLDVSGTLRNSLATTHTLLGGAGNVVVMADNTGTLYNTALSTFISSNTLWGGTRNGTIWNGDAGVGNVGIGTTSPSAKLEINYSGTSTNGLKLVQTTGYPLNGEGMIFADLQNYDAEFRNLLHLKSSGTSKFVVRADGNVGIGTAGPGTKLDVAGTLRNSLATTHTLLGAPGGVVVMADAAGTLYSTPATTVFGDYLPLTGGTLSGTLNMGGNDIMDVNKLNVTTIDPLYRIKGTNYSTYVPSFVGGVKEEYVGRVKIENKNQYGEYEKIIDFKKEKEGSDLWVWHQVVDFSENNVEVFLTPYGTFANTYYEIKDESIIIRSNRPTTVSYRFVGKRVDWMKWPTKANNQNEQPGLIIN